MFYCKMAVYLQSNNLLLLFFFYPAFHYLFAVGHCGSSNFSEFLCVCVCVYELNALFKKHHLKILKNSMHDHEEFVNEHEHRM